jgi:hypothetical protein
MVKNKTDKICLLVEAAIPSDKNVIQKEVEKKLKYKNLNIEIQRTWNMKYFTIPVTIGATEIVTKNTKNSENNTRKAFNRFSIKQLY